VHFTSYRVLENCLVFMQTNRLCDPKRVMLEPLGYVCVGGCLCCSVAVVSLI